MGSSYILCSEPQTFAPSVRDSWGVGLVSVWPAYYPLPSLFLSLPSLVTDWPRTQDRRRMAAVLSRPVLHWKARNNLSTERALNERVGQGRDGRGLGEGACGGYGRGMCPK